MAYSDLRNKVESAVSALVAAAVGATVYTASSAEELVLPRVVVEANDFTEANAETGNYYANVSVAVASSADDSTLAEHDALVAAAFDVVLTDTLPASLSAVAGLHVHGIVSTEIKAAREDRHWVDTVTVRLMCCADDQ